MNKIISSALADAVAALKLRPVWVALASEDVEDQHRRTRLGPLWLLINYLAFTGAFVFLFQPEPTRNHAAYVALGFFVWFYIMEVINQSVTLFPREEAFIKGTTLPLSVYVMRLAMQSVLRAGYAMIGCVAVLLLTGTPVTWMWACSGTALLVILAASPAAIMLFAFLGAYFADSRFIIGNFMRVGMFITPTVWTYTGGGGLRQYFYFFNPFTYFLEIVRIPIISGVFPVRSFLLCLGIVALLWGAAIYVLGRYRREVVFIL
jgi:lipopolysaccharide transport system permease protein